MDASKLPRQIESGTFADVGHCQGIAIDGACMYFSFTTMLVKTDFDGHVLGSVTGLCGHLGCLAAYGGYIWGSLEYKNDAIGKEILASTGGVSNPDTFYAARFACDKITRERMDASEVMEVIKLEDVCEDYSWTYCRLSHRHGCSGIDGITFAPCTDGSDRMLIAYGIYGDEERDDNDDQVLLSFDPKAIEPYFGKLDLSDPAPGIRCLEKLFVRTGNTRYGIQNLEYDPATGYLLAAVYRGSKKHFPNYPMYFIDWRAERGEHNYLPLAEIGEQDPETGIRGSRFGLGSTGMIALGEGCFYFSDAHAAKTEAGTVFSSTVSLYRMREDGSFDKI